MASKPKAFAEPSSPIIGLCGFRNMDLMLRILSVVLCIAILVVGGVATSKSGVILIGILGPPVSSSLREKQGKEANSAALPPQGGGDDPLVAGAVWLLAQQIRVLELPVALPHGHWHRHHHWLGRGRDLPRLVQELVGRRRLELYVRVGSGRGELDGRCGRRADGRWAGSRLCCDVDADCHLLGVVAQDDSSSLVGGSQGTGAHAIAA